MKKLASLAAGVGAFAALAAPAHAVDFVLESHVGDAWTYTLVYSDYDNMSISESGIHATITLSGLWGVTTVSGPTSADFPYQELNDYQLAWTGQVLDGGSKVVFTMPLDRVGTGNFPDARHVYGFTLIAPGAVAGDVQVATDGFYNGHYAPGSDVNAPENDRDIAKLTAGPVAVPEPASWALMILGLGVVGGAMRRRGVATPA